MRLEFRTGEPLGCGHFKGEEGLTEDVTGLHYEKCWTGGIKNNTWLPFSVSSKKQTQIFWIFLEVTRRTSTPCTMILSDLHQVFRQTF